MHEIDVIGVKTPSRHNKPSERKKPFLRLAYMRKPQSSRSGCQLMVPESRTFVKSAAVAKTVAGT